MIQILTLYLGLKVHRTFMTFKFSFGALEDAGGFWLGFGILILIWIWSVVFDAPMIQILALYIDFEAAKNIHVLEVLIWGFGGCWRFLTGILVMMHRCLLYSDKLSSAQISFRSDISAKLGLIQTRSALFAQPWTLVSMGVSIIKPQSPLSTLLYSTPSPYSGSSSSI